MTFAKLLAVSSLIQLSVMEVESLTYSLCAVSISRLEDSHSSLDGLVPHVD